MSGTRSVAIAVSWLFVTGLTGASPGAAAPSPMARVLWLEAVPGLADQKGELSLVREIATDDGRVAGFNRAIDTEAARFA